jgi:hypothetical protein
MSRWPSPRMPGIARSDRVGLMALAAMAFDRPAGWSRSSRLSMSSLADGRCSALPSGNYPEEADGPGSSPADRLISIDLDRRGV